MPRQTPAASAKKSRARAKKPALPRTEPVRSWSTLFGSNATGAHGAAPEPSPFGFGGVAGVATDSVRRGVELGYRVLDDYMRQGASAAGAFAKPTPVGIPSTADLPKMTERMMQYTSDFTSLWFDAMRIVSGHNAGRPAADARTAGSSSEGPATSDHRSRWVLEVRSERPAEIIVTLDEPVTGELVVEPLRASSGKKTIADVAVRPSAEPEGPLRVRVHVPPKLPPGRYTGVVVDAESRQPKGRLTVTLR
jgi:hypothetical protein